MLLVNVDLSEINELADLVPTLKKAADEASRDLAGMIDAKARELAAQKLHTRRKMFVDGLKTAKVEDGTMVVSLDAKVRWIDDGLPAYSMLEGLLGSKKAKRAKDGSRYIIIPFDHSPGKGKTGATSAQQDLINTVKSELKKRGIPFGSIEKGPDGQAKMGRLHSFDITNAPKKADAGLGQRRGPVGEVVQGNTGTPFLQGVTVYQSAGKGGKAQRSILTFRIASSRHKDQAKWEHPGNAPVDILEEAANWAVETFEKEIGPAIIDKALGDAQSSGVK